MFNVGSNNVNTITDIEWMLDEKENATTEELLGSSGKDERKGE